MGFDSVVIPDTFDFNSCLDRKDNFSGHFRQDLGISEKDIVFIQATRIIPRKRVEISIKLLEKLNSPGFVLLVAGRAGDEGLEYEKEIKKMAKDSRARIVFAGEHINSRRKIKGGKRIYTLWDAFTNADIMVYPTEKEGFGNQFLEATFFKKPIIITPYEVYRKDIKPLGYSVVEIGKKVLSRDVGKVRKMLNDSIEMKKMTLKNFKISKTNFSFEATREKIKKLIF